MRRFVIPSLALAVVISTISGSARAADQARVQQMVGRAAGYLRGKMSNLHGGPQSLCAIALLKAEVPANSPEIQAAILEVRKRVDPAKGYEADHEHFYSAGVGAVLLSDADAEGNRPYLEAIAKYIQDGQRSTGCWDYPSRPELNGDTSVTHYALLGLWACTRAGVEVRPEVWAKAAQWHVNSQNPDGGFSYRPGLAAGEGGANSTLNNTINGIGSMGIAWLHLSTTPPSLTEEPKPKTAPATPPKPKANSVLEAVPLEPVAPTNAAPADLPPGMLAAMRKAYNWVGKRFGPKNMESSHDTYYYYSLERMTGLVNVTRVGDHDWFAECSDLLASKQQADGSFTGFTSHTVGTDAGTAFIILSLVKSTAKLIKRITPAAKFGNGLLQGGRGLPDNLRDGDKPKDSAKPATPLDQLLASLSKATNLEVEDVQEQLVEQIQIGDRRELIQQKDLLVKLIQHPSAEIRRTAAWALGRTNDLSLARYLVTALEDPDVDVNIEAHNALCWISRKPTGFDIQLDPFEGLPLDAGPDVRDGTLKSWRSAALKAWGEWYLKNRPYKERGDEFEAKLREKLAALK